MLFYVIAWELYWPQKRYMSVLSEPWRNHYWVFPVCGYRARSWVLGRWPCWASGTWYCWSCSWKSCFPRCQRRRLPPSLRCCLSCRCAPPPQHTTVAYFLLCRSATFLLVLSLCLMGKYPWVTVTFCPFLLSQSVTRSSAGHPWAQWAQSGILSAGEAGGHGGVPLSGKFPAPEPGHMRYRWAISHNTEGHFCEEQ